MADGSTTNYGLILPEVGGSNGSWGTKLNTDLTDIDTELKAVSDVAAAALPKAGGTLTGPVKDTIVAVASAGNGVETLTLDLALGNVFLVTIGHTGLKTLQLSNFPGTGLAVSFRVMVVATVGSFFTPVQFEYGGTSFRNVRAMGGASTDDKTNNTLNLSNTETHWGWLHAIKGVYGDRAYGMIASDAYFN